MSALNHILTAMLACLTAGGIAAQNIPKTMLRLPDTGQTQGFTNTPGEDADYSIYPPVFLLNGDGTVTDTVTGLMWQQIDGGEMTVENAETYCANLVLGGFSDWRLPTAQEAYSILNQGKVNPALDVTVFADTDAEYWWSSERQTGNPAKVWVTNAGGGIGNHPKSETISAGGTKKIHVRAVRDRQTPATVLKQFALADSVVVDSLTGLEWQRFALPDSMNWENALHFAENLKLQGKNDWRLPNIKELQSINDETRSQPSLNTNFFQGVGPDRYWSSSSLPNQPARAWYLDARFGITTYADKTAKNRLLCVRGGLPATTAVTAAGGAPLRVFPNPFSNRIRLEPCGPDAVFELTDGCGRSVFVGKNIAEQDFSALPPGIYFLKILEKKPVSLKLVKI